MMDSETQRYIKEEVRRQLNIILGGQAGANDDVQNESIENLYPDSPTIEKRPVMHPFGISSRAPRGTISVTARTGEHVGNRMTLGHRDSKRPKLQEGEVALYDNFGHVFYLSKTKMQVGSMSSDEPLILGNVLKTFLTEFLDTLLNAAQIGLDVFGLPVFLEPSIRTKLVEQKQKYLTTASTNIVSQLSFTQRKGEEKK